jgi:pimeloyl-ACP methyl ester carboxylesterase
MTLSNRQFTSVGRSEFIAVEENVKLHVIDLGEGPTVVLIHGWPLSNAMYEYQYQFLVAKGYRVIGITLRGFGKSDKPFGPYNYDIFAEDIKIVLETLNVEDALLGGFSMGGAISIHFAAKYAGAHINKLALFGAAAPIWSEAEAVNGLIDLSVTNRPQLLENFGKIFGASETAISAPLAGWLGGINFEASFYATTQCLIALRDEDLREDLGKINVPTAIFHGTKDIICGFHLAEQMHAGISDSYIVKFENSGHALFIEELEKFNSELLAFLTK